MQEKKLTIKESVLWNTWGSVLYLGVQWLQTVLIARILGYEDAGIFSLAMSVANIFYALSIYGMKNFQISDMEGKYSPGNYVVSRFVTAGGAFLLCVLFTLVNGYDVKQTLCIVVYMLFKLSESFFDVCLGFYQKNWRMDFMGKSLTMRGVLMLCVFSAMMLCTHSLLWSIIAMAIAVYSVIVFYDFKNAKRLVEIRFTKDFTPVRKLLVECIPLAVYMILSTSIGSVPRYFLEMYEGSATLGIYASVATPTLIVQMAATYIFNPMVTVFSEAYAQRDKKRFVKTVRQCLMAVLSISVIGLLGGKLLGRPGLYILYGESILPYEYLLVPIILCTVTTACVWLFCNILTILRNFRALLIGNGLSVIVSALMSIVLIPLWGMQGTTFALMLGNLAGIMVCVWALVLDIRKKFLQE